MVETPLTTQNHPIFTTQNHPIWISTVGEIVGVILEVDGVKIKVSTAETEFTVNSPWPEPKLRQPVVISGFMRGTDASELELSLPAAEDLSWLEHAAPPAPTAPTPASAPETDVQDRSRLDRDRRSASFLDAIVSDSAGQTNGEKDNLNLFRPSHASFGILGTLPLYPDDAVRKIIDMTHPIHQAPHLTSFTGKLMRIDDFLDTLATPVPQHSP